MFDLLLDVVEKELFIQFDKIFHSICHLRQKEEVEQVHKGGLSPQSQLKTGQQSHKVDCQETAAAKQVMNACGSHQKVAINENIHSSAQKLQVSWKC